MDEKTKTQKEQKKERRRKFTSQMWTIILGTTISLIVTIVAAQILERNRRAKDRRLSAMMVMSNIESYAQILESAYDYMGHADTVSAWLLDLPLDKVDSLDQNSLLSLMDEVMYIPIFVYDKTAEEWTAFSEEMDEVRDAVLYHPEQYPGSSWGSKYLNEPIFRQILRNFHNMRCWLQNKIETIRYHNYVNMATIGITEQELLEFIEMREKETKVDREKPGDIIYTPNINPDSINTIHVPLSGTKN